MPSCDGGGGPGDGPGRAVVRGGRSALRRRTEETQQVARRRTISGWSRRRGSGRSRRLVVRRSPPSSITSTRSASSSASSTSWVTSRTAGRWAATVADERLGRDPGERVERAERLVEQQQVGLADQRAGQRDALALAAGELARPRRVAAVEADLGERRRGRARRASGDAQAERDVVQDRAPRQQARVLEDDGRAGPVRTVAGPPAVEAGRAIAQQRRLAAAGAAEQGDELARRDVEVDVVAGRAWPPNAAARAAHDGRARAGERSGARGALMPAIPPSRQRSARVSSARTIESREQAEHGVAEQADDDRCRSAGSRGRC